MSVVKPLDLLFLALETNNRTLHMAGYELFEMPKNYRGDYLSDLIESFRNSEVAAPFNKIVTGLERGMPRWKEVEPDLRHHVRHFAVPKPGSMDQLYDLISILNATLLDRARPLWECYVIEGVEKNRFAILIKVHHALIDGMGGMKLFARSLNTNARSRQFKTVWQPQAKRSRRSGKKENPSFAELVPGIQKSARALVDSSRLLADFNPRNMLMPFSASPSALNKPLASNERRFAACDLPLAEIKALGKATGSTVNDVVMTAIDIGLQCYLAEYSEAPVEPLRVMMPMSLHHRSGGSGGNQVSVLLTELGEPKQSPLDRLDRIKACSSRVKEEAAKVPPVALQLYTILLAAGAVVTETVPGMDRSPTNNLLISNMPGPGGELYLAGARLIGAPGSGLNVTFLSCGDNICLSIGATPDTVDEPAALARYIDEGFSALRKAAVEPAKAKRKSPARKKIVKRKRRSAAASH